MWFHLLPSQPLSLSLSSSCLHSNMSDRSITWHHSQTTFSENPWVGFWGLSTVCRTTFPETDTPHSWSNQLWWRRRRSGGSETADDFSFLWSMSILLKVVIAIAKNGQPVPWDCMQGQRVMKTTQETLTQIHSFLIFSPAGSWRVAPKTMNLSSEHCNMSDWLRLEATVKVLSSCTWWLSPSPRHHGHHYHHHNITEFKTEERGSIHPPLSPPAASLLLWPGVASKGCEPSWPTAPSWYAGWCLGHSWVLEKGSSSLWPWWLPIRTWWSAGPLTSVSFIDSTKYKILAGTWLIIILKNALPLPHRGHWPYSDCSFKIWTLCPVVLNGIPARAIGMVFPFPSSVYHSCKLLPWYTKKGNGLAILIGQILKQGKTVLIHLVQLGLHIIPTLLFIGLGKMCGVFSLL